MTRDQGDANAWRAADAYFAAALLPDDPALERALAASAEAGLPPHDVAPNQGMLLHLLARAIGARRILELGTLGGYSTIWLARAAQATGGGEVVTLELDAHRAAVAETNLEAAGLRPLVEVRVGPALESLRDLAAEGAGPFDLVFIDADKERNADYLGPVLELSRAGTLIVADNVVRAGAVADAADPDPRVRGIRRFVQRLAAEDRVAATAIQTVGVKGYDGFIVALVLA